MKTVLSTLARLPAVRAYAVCAVVLCLLAPAALGQSDVKGSYIDGAIPMDQLKLRYDNMDGMNRTDRAEFIYPKGFYSDVRNQDASTYLEVLVMPRFSAFIELHEQLVNPADSSPNTGFGDMNVGGKYALLCQADQVLSVLLRTYIPTGMPKESLLGTGHVSLDPAVLYFRKLTDSLSLEADLHDYIPIGGSDFAGNVLRYGIGLSYKVFRREQISITPVAEFVGWTVLSGKESTGLTAAGDLLFKEAGGDTIINAKMGVRIGFGDHSDLYVGYGRALTGEVWYKDVVRVEFRYKF
jgi:hypothetical protein